jgi:hypothetical protein
LSRITQDEYDRKARELKERQAEIALRIEQHHGGEGSSRETLESLVSVASRAAGIFELKLRAKAPTGRFRLFEPASEGKS